MAIIQDHNHNMPKLKENEEKVFKPGFNNIKIE